jgi:putative spermidine/putrescine transport system ATP-binding protein
VLLLDEPLSALDAKVRAQLRDEIRRIQTEVGITTLFVTHDQDEALAMADRVAVIFAGKVEQIAPPAELYERPRSARVAEFVGLSNRLPALAADGHARLLGMTLPLLPGSVTAGPVTILVRPEAVTLHAATDGPARIEAASYLGSIGRIQARLADGTPLLAQMPSAELAQFHPGAAVRVDLKPAPVLAIQA